MTRIYSRAFHTSYQYSLAYCFPDIVWTFDGWWTENRPLLPNVELTQTGDFYDFDLYLTHHPLHYSQLASELEARGIPRERIIYIQHLAYQRSLWQHNYDGVGLEVFLNDLSQSAIVCVSQFMKDQFGFYSDIGVHTIPHYVPPHLFDVAAWVPGNRTYINVVNNFISHTAGRRPILGLDRLRAKKTIRNREQGDRRGFVEYSQRLQKGSF